MKGDVVDVLIQNSVYSSRSTVTNSSIRGELKDVDSLNRAIRMFRINQE